MRKPLSLELESFWPSGNSVPLMFCNVPYSKEASPDKLKKYEGVADYRSKMNEGEAERVVS